jgi:pimeloyl-ACP methyl ester carboxylesterase
MPINNNPTLLTESFEHGGFILRWKAFGPPHAQPLIFIHGTPWSSRLWEPIARAISSTQQYCIYLFDNPGYGLSQTRTPEAQAQGQQKDLSLANQAAAFAALVRECWKLEQPPIVVVHDNGGIISLRANLLHGIEFKALCLFDVVALTPYGSPFFRLVSENPHIFKQIKRAIFEGMLRAYIREAAFKPLTAATEDILALPWLESQDTRDNFIDQIAQADGAHVAEVEGRYHEVGAKMPVKIVWAVEDAWIPIAVADRLGMMLGAKHVVTVEEAGHLIMLDRPERVVLELLVWLAEVNL